MTDGQANFFQSLGWAVLNSLWQLALLWVTYQLLIFLFNFKRPATRSTLASSFLISGFVWFVYTFFSIYNSTTVSDGIAASGFLKNKGNTELSEWLLQILPLASAVYLILLIFPLLRFFKNYRYVQIIRRYGLSRIDVEWRIFVSNITARMGIKHKVSIWVSELVASPVTIGFLKPVILIPLAVINHLTPQQLEAVLLHELSHIKRFDYFINLIINCIQTILYFNPFVKAFVKIVEKEREISCDEMVLQFQYDSHEYASALLILEKNSCHERILALAANGRKKDLLYRIETILGVKKNRFFSFNKIAGVFAGLLCIITLNVVLIIAQQEPGKRISSFTSFSSPFNFFDDNENINPATVIINEKKDPPVFSISKPSSLAPATVASESNYQTAPSYPGYMNVNYEPVAEVPELKKYQEQQVKEAIAASKNVLEKTQWKAIEKNMADVFTRHEKEALKSTFEKEIDKIDWNDWENKLRLAYNNVDWDKVNNQIYNAVNQVRIDSLHKVYSQALVQLEKMETSLNENNLRGIPDTDITLKLVEQSKRDAIKTLNKVKAVRSKKIVHL